MEKWLLEIEQSQAATLSTLYECIKFNSELKPHIEKFNKNVIKEIKIEEED